MAQLVSSISRSVVQLIARRDYPDGTEHHTRSVLTGFFWSHKDKVYLVTNWHNVAGLRSDTLKPNGSFLPTVLNARFWICLEQDGGRDKLALRARDLCLYDKDGKALWIEHTKRNEVDIVVLQINKECFDEARPYCLNQIDFEKRWQPDIGSECFVVGFPKGLSGPMNTPIWKRGSVATEPHHNAADEPVFLIDTLGNEGLSGSSVIGQSSGIFNDNQAIPLTMDATIGTWRNFAGIYSGRTSIEGVGFQLGRVWKSQLLNEIFESGVPGSNPMQFS